MGGVSRRLRVDVQVGEEAGRGGSSIVLQEADAGSVPLSTCGGGVVIVASAPGTSTEVRPGAGAIELVGRDEVEAGRQRGR